MTCGRFAAAALVALGEDVLPNGDAQAGANAKWRSLRSSTLGRTEVAAARSGRAVYVVGGYTVANGLDQETNALQRYEPQTNSWSRLKGAPTARAALAAGVIRNRLFAVGGAANGAALDRLDIYNFKRDTWSTGVKKLRKARGGIAAATVGGRIVVVGGEEGAGTIAEVEAYEPRRRRRHDLKRLPTPRHGVGAIAYRGSIYVLEGGPTPGLSCSRRVEALRVAP